MTVPYGESSIGLLVLKKVTDLPASVPKNPHHLHFYFNEKKSETCTENLVCIILLFPLKNWCVDRDIFLHTDSTTLHIPCLRNTKGIQYKPLNSYCKGRWLI